MPINADMRPSEFLKMLNNISGLSLTKLHEIKRELVAKGEIIIFMNDF